MPGGGGGVSTRQHSCRGWPPPNVWTQTTKRCPRKPSSAPGPLTIRLVKTRHQPEQRGQPPTTTTHIPLRIIAHCARTRQAHLATTGRGWRAGHPGILSQPGRAAAATLPPKCVLWQMWRTRRTRHGQGTPRGARVHRRCLHACHHCPSTPRACGCRAAGPPRPQPRCHWQRRAGSARLQMAPLGLMFGSQLNASAKPCISMAAGCPNSRVRPWPIATHHGCVIRGSGGGVVVGWATVTLRASQLRWSRHSQACVWTRTRKKKRTTQQVQHHGNPGDEAPRTRQPDRFPGDRGPCGPHGLVKSAGSEVAGRDGARSPHAAMETHARNRKRLTRLWSHLFSFGF